MSTTECQNSTFFQRFHDSLSFTNAKTFYVINGGNFAMISDSTNEAVHEVVPKMLTVLIGLSTGDFMGSESSSDFRNDDGLNLSDDFGTTPGMFPWANNEHVDFADLEVECVRMVRQVLRVAFDCRLNGHFVCQFSFDDPALSPTMSPTILLTIGPSRNQTLQPNVALTYEPSYRPTLNPSLEPTLEPNINPALVPSKKPTTEQAI